MPDRLNDTDPQSPAAMVSRTDPGLGSPPILVVGPTDPLPPELEPPVDASIEDLIDGITGPRPPPSVRRAGNGDSARAYSAARPAPASQPMPRVEPAVMSPQPPQAGDRDALTVPRTVDTEPRGKVVRPPPQESTVYTGRRAITRNVVVVVFSAALFAAGMMGLLHWKEQGASRSSAAAAIVVAPLPASPEVAAPAASIVIVSPPPAEPAAPPAPAPAPLASVTGASVTIAPNRAVTPKHARATSHSTNAAAGSLDDLNREISH